MRMKDKQEIKPDAGRHTRDFDWDQLGQACLTRPRVLPAVSHGKNEGTMRVSSWVYTALIGSPYATRWCTVQQSCTRNEQWHGMEWPWFVEGDYLLGVMNGEVVV